MPRIRDTCLVFSGKNCCYFCQLDRVDLFLRYAPDGAIIRDGHIELYRHGEMVGKEHA